MKTLEKTARKKPASRYATTKTAAVLRRECREAAKTAELGGEPSANFERSFGSLAYAYLKDRAPKLLDHVVGFQLVDRNQDNTKAIGAFVFKVGDRKLEAPVFFLNGDLKGHELLRLADSDNFVPLKEAWINAIIADKAPVLGRGSSRNWRELGGQAPQLQPLLRPDFLKNAGERNHIADWARPIVSFMAAVRAKKASTLFPGTDGNLDVSAIVAAPYSAAAVASGLDVDALFKESFEAVKTAFELCESYPVVKEATAKHYGEDFFERMARHHMARAVAAEKAASDKIPEAPVRLPLKMAADITPANSKVRVVENPSELAVTGSIKDLLEAKLDPFALAMPSMFPETKKAEQQLHEDAAGLTDEHRAEILHKGFTVIDKRAESEISEAFRLPDHFDVANPSVSGVYDLLVGDGNFEEAVILVNPISPGMARSLALVIRKSDGASFLAARGRLLVADGGGPKSGELDKWIDGLAGFTLPASSDDYDWYTRYAVVMPGGQASVPFRCHAGDGGYRKASFRDYVSGDLEDELDRKKYDGIRGVDGEGVRVSPAASKIKAVGCELVIPESAKKISLPEQSDEMAKFMPGRLRDLEARAEKTAGVRTAIYARSDGYLIRRGDRDRDESGLSKLAATRSLILGDGLSAHSAAHMLAEADAKRNGEAAVFGVKRADGYGYMAPAEPPRNESYETLPSGLGYRTNMPQEDQVTIDSMRAMGQVRDPYAKPGQNDPSGYGGGGGGGGYGGNGNGLQEAAQKGDRDQYDIAVFRTMARTTHGDAIIDKQLPACMKCLDALGRLLFHFYWHNDQFEERYGRGEMLELESGLRTAFEDLGDVTLKLKNKRLTVDGMAGSADTEPNVDDIAY